MSHCKHGQRITNIGHCAFCYAALEASNAALVAECARLRETVDAAALQVHSAIDQLAKHADARDGEDAKVRLSDLFDALIAALAQPKETP